MVNCGVKAMIGLIALSLSSSVHAAECTLEGVRTLADAHLNVLGQAAVAIPHIDKAQSDRFEKLMAEGIKKYLEGGKVPKGSEFMQTSEYIAWSALKDIEKAEQAVTVLKDLSKDSKLKEFIKSAAVIPSKLDAAYDSWDRWYVQDTAPTINEDYSMRIINGFNFGIAATEIFIKSCADKIP